MGRVFADDFCDLILPGERMADDCFKIQSESYFFVKCSNYQNHTDEIKNSSVVSIVLPSVENPSPVAYSSISRFERTTKWRIKSKDDVSIGDLVRVKAGFLKNLFGIVVKKNGKNSYNVFFRLYTRQFVESLRQVNLEICDCLWNYVQFPVVEKGKKLTENMISTAIDIGDRRKICANKIR